MENYSKKPSERKPVTIDHHIQRTIMKALLATPTATYSMLKPKAIESNLFLYHLRQLIRTGLVEKNDKAYRLSIVGKQYLDRANLDTMVMHMQPKLVVMLVVKNSQGQYLILERLHQPFLGMKGFMSSKLWFGEQLEEAAYRELTGKSNLTVDDVTLTPRGNVLMRFFNRESGAIMNHVIAYVFTGTTDTTDATQASRPDRYEAGRFRSSWVDESMLQTDMAIKGHYEIAQLLERKDYFVESFDFESFY